MHTSPNNSQSRLLSVAAHIGPVVLAFVSAGTLAFAAPLGIWLFKRNDDRFVAEHARTALNFQLTLLALAFAAAVIGKLTFGIGWLVLGPALLAVFVVSIVLSVIGAVRAYKGFGHRYPMSFNFVG